MEAVSGFIFDRNKCVGCQACVVACQVENDLPAASNWRRVYSSSDLLPPRLPRFHLSLACNHCEHPACLEACPSGSYSPDRDTGAVVLHQEYCMGCRYCTWACPYDAPVFNERTGLIEKCTFCVTRLHDGKSPACCTNCPTGALDFRSDDTGENIKSETGFPESKLHPRIRFTRNRDPQPLQIWPDRIIKKEGRLNQNYEHMPDNRVQMRSEWTLYVFTLLVPVLVGMYAGLLSGFLVIHPALFAGFLVSAILLSMLHLGRKTRAFFAFRNLKTSWLSREILGFVIFSVFSVLSISVAVMPWWLAFAVLATGLFTLFAMDRVYTYFRNPNHSASILLTGFMWIALILQEPIPLFFIIVIKTVLYIWRKYAGWHQLSRTRKWVSIFRMVLLAVIPAGIILYDSSLVLESFFPLLLGECIDRWEFYKDHQIASPAHELNQYEQKIVQGSMEMQ